MINATVMMLEKIGEIIASVLAGRLQADTDGLYISVLTLFIFEWVIFAFVKWLKAIWDRTG